jgi:hypothetical protein
MSEQVTGTGSGARVGIVMGSDSDWPVMQAAAEACREFDVEIEADVVSAHRMPHEMLAYGEQAAERGLSVIIAGAGGAAHLPGMLAAVTPLPVIGVPVSLPVEEPELREQLRSGVLGLAVQPQVLLRLGWPHTSSARLPGAPRRPIDDVLVP